MAWIGRFDDFADLGNFDQSNVSERNHSIQRKRGYHNHYKNSADKYYDDSLNPSEMDGRTVIYNISSNMQNVSIAGVVIAREGPRVIISKKGSGTERHLMCLTVRDGPMSFINVSCWGNEEYAKFVHSVTAVGAIIEVKGAQVQEKSNPADEKFKPWTPSSCQLTVGENNGCVCKYAGGSVSVEHFVHLLHLPPRPCPVDFYSLDDIQSHGIDLQGQHLNILAIVKKVWPVRDITTKTGKRTSKVDVALCDETCLTFGLTLWDSFVELAEKWLPMETVILVSDVKIVYNDFKSTMAASSDSKTIFTSDPDMVEAHSLYNFAKSQGSFVAENGVEAQFSEDNRDPDLNSITNVLTIQEAKAVRDTVVNHEGKAAYGVMYSFLSQFDVDGQEKACLRHICSKCRKTVSETTGFVCCNSNCAGVDMPGQNQMEFSFTVSFSDPTGTLDSCYLQPSVAEQLLGYKADEFCGFSAAQKTSIKWIYLLEKTKAVIKIRKGNGHKTYVTVLALEKEAS